MKLKHIELKGAIVNIREGLYNRKGEEVISIEIIADGDRYAGEPSWWINGRKGKSYLNVLVVKKERKKK